ncbi:MAG: glycosyltransferase [Bacteroidia bacterium]
MDNNDKLPFVSVLVAARNEEENILKCLESLSKLNYPYDKFEVLIGDDGSTDKTAENVKRFIEKHSFSEESSLNLLQRGTWRTECFNKLNQPNIVLADSLKIGEINQSELRPPLKGARGMKNHDHFCLINITDNLGSSRGKSNVLAQLTRVAKGQYFLITDADMQVPESWIQSHLKHFSGDVYMTSGTTLSKPGKSFFSKLQNAEWIYLMGLFNSIDQIRPITAMGNNMAFRADKYFETGGYEDLPFSVTEDIQLMNEFLKRGYKHKHILEAENLSWQTPLYAVSDLLKQRKRWFQGGKKQPVYIWVLFMVYAAFLPVSLTLFFLNWQTAIYILAGKCFVDGIFLLSISNRLKVKINLLWLPVFEIYLSVINPLILIYSIFTKKVEWKERKY